MTPDVINGIFEFGGGILLWLNVRQLLKDKDIKGIFWPVQIFFSAWGFWNLYYYPSLEQWMSFWGGVSLVAANTTWLGFAIYYMNRKK